MLYISEPKDSFTCNFLKGLAVLINTNDENSISSISAGIIEVTTKYRLNKTEEVYLDILGWSKLEDKKTWRYC